MTVAANMRIFYIIYIPLQPVHLSKTVLTLENCCFNGPRVSWIKGESENAGHGAANRDQLEPWSAERCLSQEKPEIPGFSCLVQSIFSGEENERERDLRAEPQ